MQYVIPKISDPAALEQLNTQLEQSLELFRRGEDIAGAHLLQEFESAANKAIQYNEWR